MPLHRQQLALRQRDAPDPYEGAGAVLSAARTEQFWLCSHGAVEFADAAITAALKIVDPDCLDELMETDADEPTRGTAYPGSPESVGGRMTVRELIADLVTEPR